MRHLKLSSAGVIFLLFVLTPSLVAQKSKALMYMEKINREMDAITADSWEYTSEVAHGKNARKVETKRRELVRTSKMAMEKVGRMDAFEGSTQFRDSMVSYLRIHYLVLNEDYEKILNMEEIAEQSYDRMEAYLLAKELADDKLDEAGERMQEQQKQFAAANNINLLTSTDKVTIKLEKAGEVMKHYNVVYLIFFKCFKQEAYLIDASNKKDINAMEQNKNALISASEEGLDKLKGVPAYKGDKSLVYACKSCLDFYHQEASVKMDGVIDFYLQDENFKKLKASFDLKPQKERTNADVSEYNDAVKELNRKLNAFNKQNDGMNKARTGALNDWDRTAKNFLDKHIPKYK